MTNQDHVINFCGAARALASQTKVMTDQELANIYEMSRMISKLLDDTRKELTARCKAHGNAGQAKKLDAEIAKLDKQIQEMKAYNKRLANISVRLAV